MILNLDVEPDSGIRISPMRDILILAFDWFESRCMLVYHIRELYAVSSSFGGGRYGGVKRFGVIFFLKSVNISFFLKKSVVLGLRI